MGHLFTIGHSTHPIEEFVAILRAHSVTLVADIRTVPRSRHNPQFDEAALRASLTENGIAYSRLAALGGLRRTSPESINTGWKNPTFRGYADYMQTAEFASALDALIALLDADVVTIMCAEAVPWRCHRSLVGDALLVRGIDVDDIYSATSVKPQKLTGFARVDGLTLTYPPLEETA
ncbi:DUF488 domain-containing protein [Mycetocola sp. 2940]|uniref:DUF488 domain-containing protein n=1 Tax=Mycetocola sp. 2940 TaxID=3156452 RepID=UPI0033932DA8